MRKFYSKHKLVRVLVRIIIVLLIFLLLAFLFLKIWPPFGGTASKADRKDYAKRADNYVNGKFVNDGDFSIMRSADGMVDPVVSTKGSTPSSKIPTKEPTYLEDPLESELNVTWFGHSTLLLQMHGMNILVDPVLSKYSSPVQFLGAKRFSNPPITAEDLPHIDIVILSHDHFDHMDYNTILDIDDRVDSYIVPLGVENHLERWGILKKKIYNMAWWEEIDMNGLTIGCTPARHYSGRSLTDQYRTLWASWVLKDENYQIFESGDTGYGEHFEDIYKKYGDFDLALLDSAQYNVRWPDVHMNPEEAYGAAEVLHAAVAMPIHWGAFKLASHPWDDPAERFTLASEKGSIPVVTPVIGETMILSEYEDYMVRWWRNID